MIFAIIELQHIYISKY